MTDKKFTNAMWKIPLAVVFLAYGIFGLSGSEIYVGARTRGYVLEGIGAIIASAGFICGSLAFILSSFEKKPANDNTRPWKSLSGKITLLAFGLIFIGTFWYLLELAKIIKW